MLFTWLILFRVLGCIFAHLFSLFLHAITDHKKICSALCVSAVPCNTKVGKSRWEAQLHGKSGPGHILNENGCFPPVLCVCVCVCVHVSCTAERRLAQPDNDYALVLTVPDENLCKQAILTAACVLAVARLLRMSCVCVCVCACVCARVCALRLRRSFLSPLFFLCSCFSVLIVCVSGRYTSMGQRVSSHAGSRAMRGLVARPPEGPWAWPLTLVRTFPG